MHDRQAATALQMGDANNVGTEQAISVDHAEEHIKFPGLGLRFFVSADVEAYAVSVDRELQMTNLIALFSTADGCAKAPRRSDRGSWPVGVVERAQANSVLLAGLSDTARWH